MSTLKVKGIPLLLNTIGSLKSEQKGWIAPEAIAITLDGDMYIHKDTKFLLNSTGGVTYTVPIHRDEEGNLIVDLSEVAYAFMPLNQKQKEKLEKKLDEWLYCKTEIEIIDDERAWYRRYSIDTLLVKVENLFDNYDTNDLAYIIDLIITKLDTIPKLELRKLKILHNFFSKDYEAELQKDVELELETESELSLFQQEWPKFKTEFVRIAKIISEKINEMLKDYESLNESELDGILTQALNEEDFELATTIRRIKEKKFPK